MGRDILVLSGGGGTEQKMKPSWSGCAIEKGGHQDLQRRADAVEVDQKSRNILSRQSKRKNSLKGKRQAGATDMRRPSNLMGNGVQNRQEGSEARRRRSGLLPRYHQLSIKGREPPCE